MSELSSTPRAGALAAALLLAACGGPTPGPPLREPDLGPSLGASRADPLLLSVAAARPRSRYLVDQGYTLAWDADDVPAFTTDDAGDLGVVIEADGYLNISEDDLLAPIEIAHTASDAAVLHLAIDPELSADLWFAVGSSGAATLDVRLTSAAVYPRHVSVIPWLRRCAGSFTGVAASGDGIRARHTSTPDARLVAAGPGTFVTDLADGLEGDEAPVAVLGAASCGASADDDLGVMIDLASPAPATAAMVALQFDRDLAPRASVEIPVHRAVADASKPDDIATEIAAERGLALDEVLLAGQARLAAAPPPAGLSPADALVHHASIALVDQVTMPAEGRLGHDYYVFSRAPGFWSARLGDRPHESLSTILLAHLDPREAAEIHRNLIDAVGPGGYVPYRIGPVVEQTGATTAAAPLFSFEAWEIAALAGADADPSFLADAYAAGQKIHAFWVAERDQDHDGLAEWASVTESVRDPGDVIWKVAPPGAVDAVDLNCMLVMEEKSLAKMATALGKAGEAATWQAAAADRAARINALMWDEATGFYYDVALATHTFTYATPGDLRRMEIAGLLPLWAGIAPADRRAKLVARLADPAVFLRRFGVASLAAGDPSYAPELVGAAGSDRWNGPVAVPWQWLVVRGLRAAGETALADEITLRARAAVSAELSRSHLFRELYDPDDAGPPNASMPNYVWSSMIALMALEAGAQ